MEFLNSLWNSQYAFAGSTLIAFFVFNLLFMLMGRFRFCFLSTLIFVYYTLMFENRPLLEKFSTNFGTLGYFAVNIIMGVLFLGLAVWSFFIDSD